MFLKDFGYERCEKSIFFKNNACILYIYNDETANRWTINTMILSAGLVQMLLRNPKKQMRNSQSLCVARNSSIYILTSGYIHSSGFVLSTFSKKCEKRLMQVEILKG